MTSNRELASTVLNRPTQVVLAEPSSTHAAGSHRVGRARRAPAYGRVGRRTSPGCATPRTVGRLVVTRLDPSCSARPAAIDSSTVRSNPVTASTPTVLLYGRGNGPGQRHRGHYAVPAASVLSRPPLNPTGLS